MEDALSTLHTPPPTQLDTAFGSTLPTWQTIQSTQTGSQPQLAPSLATRSLAMQDNQAHTSVFPRATPHTSASVLSLHALSLLAWTPSASLSDRETLGQQETSFPSVEGSTFQTATTETFATTAIATPPGLTLTQSA
jgi:hypothetical protein